jgi:hypothetical protein
MLVTMIDRPHVRAVVAAPVALRAAGASWLRHWQTVLAPALDAVGGEIVSLEMRFSGAEIVAVAPDPTAAFQAIVEVLDASPEARDFLTRVELVGLDAPDADRSYQKRPHEAASG